MLRSCGGGDGYEKALAASFDMVEFDALDNLVGPYDLTHRKKKPVGVEYADAGDFTPEQLAEARKMITDAQNVHPGVMPGYDNPYPVESEALGRADRKIAETAALGAAGVVAPEAAALARGSITASRFVAAADFFNNATGGYSAGYTGQPFSPTTSSFAARWGAGLGWGAGAFQRTIGINRAVKFGFGLFE